MSVASSEEKSMPRECRFSFDSAAKEIPWKEMKPSVANVVWLFFGLFFCKFGVEAKMVENFEQPGKLGDSWMASEGMRLERVLVPVTVKHEGVDDNILQVDAVAGGYFATQPNFHRRRFHAATAVKFRAEAPNATAANPLVFEFQVYSTERRAWRWRKVTIDGPGWRTIELPTRFFRHSPSSHVKWEETRQLAFMFRNAGRLNVDMIELVDAPYGDFPAELLPKEIGRMAFGSKARIHRGKHFMIITDEPRLKPTLTFEALDHMKSLLMADFPGLRSPPRPPVLLIFSKEARYREFWGQLAEAFNSTGPRPESDGYSMLGISGSFFDPRQGSIRPVFAHEGCHALLTHAVGLASEGDWLQEGLATYYQLRCGKQDLGPLAKRLIAERSLVPLGQLLNGKPIDVAQYAQAALFIDWIMAHPTRKARLLPAMRAMAKQGSTNFSSVSKAQFGADLATIQPIWLRWLQSR
jgi:hypothetical protein